MKKGINKSFSKLKLFNSQKKLKKESKKERIFKKE